MTPEKSSMDLITWLRQLGSLLGAGVPLGRTLNTLAETGPDRLREATAAALEAVMTCATLSDALTAWPDLFPRATVVVIRIGEVAGMLDEAVLVWAELLERAAQARATARRDELLWELAVRAGLVEEAGGTGVAWGDLEQALLDVAFCRLLAMSLSAGVPPERALAEVARLYPPDHPRAAALAAPEPDAALSEALRAAGFPASVPAIVRSGEIVGQVDRFLDRAADMLEAEWDLRLAALYTAPT